MYKTLGYHSVYDAGIQDHAATILGQDLAMKQQFHQFRAPVVEVEVMKKGKPKMTKRPATCMSELIIAHAQRIKAVSCTVPLETIVADLTTVITSYQAA